MLWQVQYAALGTKGKDERMGSALPLYPLWSLVFLFAPGGLSTRQRKGLWKVRGLPPALRSLGPWYLRGGAEVFQSKPRLTPLSSLLVGA